MKKTFGVNNNVNDLYIPSCSFSVITPPQYLHSAHILQLQLYQHLQQIQLIFISDYFSNFVNVAKCKNNYNYCRKDQEELGTF